jgi:hypothetical protein
MLAAIQFDDQFRRRTKEIYDVRTNGLLAAESQSGKLFATQNGPENSFGVRRIGTQRFRQRMFMNSSADPLFVVAP